MISILFTSRENSFWGIMKLKTKVILHTASLVVLEMGLPCYQEWHHEKHKQIKWMEVRGGEPVSCPKLYERCLLRLSQKEGVRIQQVKDKRAN